MMALTSTLGLTREEFRAPNSKSFLSRPSQLDTVQLQLIDYITGHTD
jgi:hypothetical protein